MIGLCCVEEPWLWVSVMDCEWVSGVVEVGCEGFCAYFVSCMCSVQSREAEEALWMRVCVLCVVSVNSVLSID